MYGASFYIRRYIYKLMDRSTVKLAKNPKPGYTYFIHCKEVKNMVKVGKATDHIKRIKQLQTGNPYQLMFYKLLHFEDPYALETYLHRKYQPQHFRGEWYTLETAQIDNAIENLEEFIRDYAQTRGKKIQSITKHLEFSGVATKKADSILDCRSCDNKPLFSYHIIWESESLELPKLTKTSTPVAVPEANDLKKPEISVSWLQKLIPKGFSNIWKWGSKKS